jgi:hypothetical protein
MKVTAAPVNTPPTHGYEPTHEAAMAALGKAGAGSERRAWSNSAMPKTPGKLQEL